MRLKCEWTSTNAYCVNYVSCYILLKNKQNSPFLIGIGTIWGDSSSNTLYYVFITLIIFELVPVPFPQGSSLLWLSSCYFIWCNFDDTENTWEAAVKSLINPACSHSRAAPLLMAQCQWSPSRSVISNCVRPRGLYSPWNSAGQNTGVGSLSLLQGIFPTQGLNSGLPHCRRILYQLSYRGSPRILEWVAYPFSSGSSQPRNRTGVSCIAGRFFTSWASREALSTREGIISPALVEVSWPLLPACEVMAA